MTGFITSDTTVSEALDGSMSGRLVASDGPAGAGSLEHRMIQSGLEANGFKISAEVPQGPRASFNTAMADASVRPVAPTPAQPAPDLGLTQTMTMKNG